jgi:hypothetical protein
MICTKTLTLALSLFVATAWSLGLTNSVSAQQSVKVFHKTAKVGDLDIFYREAGPKDAPTILLLHGFPTSSQMFRNLIPALADQYYVVAPDYPGFGHSSMPSRDNFTYTFDNLAKVVDEFTQKIGLTKYALPLKPTSWPLRRQAKSPSSIRAKSIVIRSWPGARTPKSRKPGRALRPGRLRPDRRRTQTLRRVRRRRWPSA